MLEESINQQIGDIIGASQVSWRCRRYWHDIGGAGIITKDGFSAEAADAAAIVLASCQF